MTKKAKKAAIKKPKKPAQKKPVAKKKPAKAPVKKAKPVIKKAKTPVKKAKSPVIKAKAPAKKKPVIHKPVAKKMPIVKKPAPKALPQKAVKAPEKVVLKTPPPKIALKPKVKPDIKALLKSGLKLLPKPLPSEVKDDKKPKELYTLEYMINSSPDILFDFISTAAGLEKWFAERVYVKDNLFTFNWENDEHKQARLVALKEREFARFHWLDQGDKRYFEFRIQIDDLTGEVALMVSDFADNATEYEDSRLLWNAQINDLLHALGSP